MLEDGYINTMTVLCAVLWTMAGLCLIAAWVSLFMARDGSFMPQMFIVTALMISIGALVAHMRKMTLRVCALIRATSRTEGDRDADLRVLR